MPLPANACSNCGEPVQVRRPSKTGKHFCKASKCQTAKQRHYREARELGTKDLIVRLVRDLVNLERKRCSSCDLENALPGWAHRDTRNPVQPCFGVGSLGAGVPGDVIDAIWPELRPGATR